MNGKWVLWMSMVAGLWALAGCASAKRPPFQPIAGHEYGYRIEDSPHKWIFKVTTVLPAKLDEKYGVFYGYRAIGEECARRGYRFFDAGMNTPHDLDGYCYPSKDHEGLGLEFAAIGLEVRPQKFIVASLNGKTKTQLKEKDELVGISGKPVTSIAHLKAETVKAILAGATLVDLEVRRDDQTLKVKEPIAVFKNSSMGSEVLDLARSRVQ